MMKYNFSCLILFLLLNAILDTYFVSFLWYLFNASVKEIRIGTTRVGTLNNLPDESTRYFFIILLTVTTSDDRLAEKLKYEATVY